MAKDKKNSNVDEDMDVYEHDTAPVRDVKKLVFGIWGLIIFGLLGAFILSTSQNYDNGTGGAQQQPTTAATGNNAAAALQSLQAELAKDPNNIDVLISLGFAYIDQSSFQDAATSFEKALKIAPTNVDGLVGLGMAYQYLSRVNDALAQYDKALQVDPNSDLAKLRKGFFLADVQNDKEGALKLLREVEAKQKLGGFKTQLRGEITKLEKRP